MWRFLFVSLLACIGFISSVKAGEFERAFQAALIHDAEFQAAKFALESGEQALPLAESGLLPSVTYNASGTAESGVSSTDVAGTSSTRLFNYLAPSQSISVRMPLYNQEATQRVRQAASQVESAQATFLNSKAQLVDRLASAYLQFMLAEDNFVATHIQVHSIVTQRNLMRRKFEQGEGTITEVAEARANLSIHLALWAQAKDQLSISRQALALITGQQLDSIARLGEVFQPIPLVPAALDTWQLMALQSNPEVVAQRRMVDALQAGVARANAGSQPRLDFVASASHRSNESAGSLNQSTTQGSIGVQLNIPLYTGGAVKASVAQALAEKSKAEADLTTTMRETELDVARLFQAIQTGFTILEAYHSVLESSQLALHGTEQGQASGMRTNAEVLEAMRKVYQARRDLAQVRYDHIIQRLRLYNKAGILADSVVSYMDELLTLGSVND
jgi:outer membrane protein, protease secretion system